MTKTATSTKRPLFEAATLIGESASADGTWKVRLIAEGKGSSGLYNGAMLEQHHHALDDLLSFKNHPGEWEGPETRDFTMIAGEIVGETWVERDERGMIGVYGNYRPDPEYKDKLERYKNKLGVSIYIEGSGFINGDGDFEVDWLNPADPYASLDVVIAAGARGRFEESMKTMYARRSAEHKTSTASVVEKEETLTMDKDVEARFDALETAITGLVASKQAEAKTEADAAAVESAVTEKTTAIKSAVEAVESAKADLLPLQHKSLLERAWKGEDVTPAIESEKAIAKEALEAAAAKGANTGETHETGRLGEGAGSTEGYTFRGFGEAK